MGAHSNIATPDVLVIGGGPAGSAAAITCAQSGLDVTLVERDAFPRHRPGETLHPGIEPILRQLGVGSEVNNAGFLRHPGVRIIVGNSEEHFEPYGSDNSGSWFGYQADREQFDAILLRRAREVGVQILQPCRAMDLWIQGGMIRGVVTTQQMIEPRYVIDATGMRSWLTIALGIRFQFYSPRLLVQYGYSSGNLPADSIIPTFQMGGNGWFWDAPLGHGHHAWARLITQGESIDRLWKPPSLGPLHAIGPSRFTDVSWRLSPVTATSNFFAVGDAAAVLDPASSHGVLRALMTGIYAGQLIQASLGRKLSCYLAARHYRQWLEDWFQHDVARLSTLYGQLLGPFSEGKRDGAQTFWGDSLAAFASVPLGRTYSSRTAPVQRHSQN